MIPILARDLAALGRVTEGASFERVLRGVTEAIARGVPGCAGGSAEFVAEFVAVAHIVRTASHSELIAVAARERDLREGPSSQALATGLPVAVADVMRDTRWPRYAAAAVRHGVRSVLIVPVQVEGGVVLLGLYGVRPGVFAGQETLTDLLREQVSVVLANIWEFDDVRTGAAQMREAMAGRALIDQAKGIIMQAGGCSAEEAFEELRRLSQHHQVKVADLARLLVTEHQQKNAKSVRE